MIFLIGGKEITSINYNSYSKRGYIYINHRKSPIYLKTIAAEAFTGPTLLMSGLIDIVKYIQRDYVITIS